MVKSNKRRDEERRVAAAAKIAEMQQAQRAAERRRRSIIVSAVALAVVVVVVGISLIILTQNSTPKVDASGVAGATTDYGFVVGKASAPASMVVYEDFQCPNCEQFESASGTVLDGFITDGKLKVEYRPIAFLDAASNGNNYSTRALNAAACVRNFTDAATFKKFHDVLFKNQPAEDTSGRTDDELVGYAVEAGASSTSVKTCITDQTFKNWTVSATDASSKAGVTGTPTVTLDGTAVPGSALLDPTALTTLINDAVANDTK